MDPTAAHQRDAPTLMSLPPELLLAIFQYAYPANPKLTPIDRETWESHERRRRRERRDESAEYSVRPFPTLKIDEFLVSKAFLSLAADVYVGNSNLFLDSLWPNSSKESIIIVHTRQVTVTSLGVMNISALPPFQRLKSLTMNFDKLALLCDLDKDPWLDEMAADDWAPWLQTHWALLDIRGLDKFEFRLEFKLEYEIMRHGDARGRERHEQLLSNLKGLGAVVCGLVTQPRLPKTSKAPHDSNGREALRDENVDSVMVRCTAQDEASSAGVLDDNDIPDTLEEMKAMLKTDGPAVMAWVKEVKRRNQQPPMSVGSTDAKMQA